MDVTTNNKRKVLYLSYDGMTDPLGQSQVLPYIAGLTKKGYEFHLISFEKMDRYKQHHEHIRKICKSANIQWHPQDYHNTGGILKTIRQVRKLNKVALFLHQKHQFDIVHCRSYISALTGLKLQKKGCKFLFDMRGFWADERVDGKIWDLSSPIYKTIYKFFKRKEIRFFSQSDYTISLTENGKDEILSWDALKGQEPLIQVIPCCVNLDLFDPKKISEPEQEQLRASLGIQPTDFIIGYVGSIGTWYMLPEMLHYFSRLKRVRPTARFMFVTGEPEQLIYDEALNYGLSKDDFIITSTLHSGVPLHISLFDCSIFFIRPSYSKKASSPTKQGEIMAMGVPLICNSGVGDTDAIVLNYQSGIVIDELNEDNYDQHIIDPTQFDAATIQAGANDYFSLEEGVNRYFTVYRSFYE